MFHSLGAISRNHPRIFTGAWYATTAIVWSSIQLGICPENDIGAITIPIILESLMLVPSGMISSRRIFDPRTGLLTGPLRISLKVVLVTSISALMLLYLIEIYIFEGVGWLFIFLGALLYYYGWLLLVIVLISTWGLMKVVRTTEQEHWRKSLPYA